MGKTFKIGLGSLGGTWGLAALNAPILSKNKVITLVVEYVFGKAPG